MSQDQTEVISIGITTYDRIDLLIETISSVTNQTYKNLEIIIANDNPTRTLTMEQLGLKEDSRILIVNHSRNLGEIDNLNWLLDHASGRFFTWIADDDLLHPQHIEILLKGLMTDRRAICAYSGYTSNLNNFTDLKTFIPEVNQFICLNLHHFLIEFSKREINIIGCYGLFDRTSLTLVGGFKRLGNGFSPYSDTLIPILMGAMGPIAITTLPTLFFRSHNDSMSNSSTNIHAYLTAEADFIESLNHTILGIPTFAKNQLLMDFSRWFQENHLTLIARTNNNIFGQFLAWKEATRANRKLFLQYETRVVSDFLKGLIFLLKHRFSIHNYINP